MGSFGRAVQGDCAKTRMMYTLASEMFGQLDELVAAGQCEDGTLDEDSVIILRACLDAAIGMAWALNGEGWGDTEPFDVDLATRRMRDHTESSRLWDEAGEEAGSLVGSVYSEIAREVTPDT